MTLFFLQLSDGSPSVNRLINCGNCGRWSCQPPCWLLTFMFEDTPAKQLQKFSLNFLSSNPFPSWSYLQPNILVDGFSALTWQLLIKMSHPFSFSVTQIRKSLLTTKGRRFVVDLFQTSFQHSYTINFLRLLSKMLHGVLKLLL